MPTVSVRLSEEEKQRLEDAAELLGQDRSSTLRQAMAEGIETLRTRHAVERYQAGDASTVEAARLAGVTVGEWLELAGDRGLTTQLDPTDLRFDAERARKL
jgi:predicted HTH domain antitoxin